jgi:ubiquinone/menaquinone biosynthesis C-methylase UbiE
MKDYLKKTVETYNKIAKIYSDYTFNLISQYHLNEFISLLPKKGKILDAGCGSGRDVAYLSEDGFDAIGIDISEGLLKEARKRVKGKFKKMDITEMKFKDEEFDGIWSCATLYHLKKEDVSKILKDFNKILKKKGVLFINVKEGEGSEVVKKKEYGDLPRYIVYYSLAEILNLVEEAGFKVINSFTDEGPENNWINVFARKV